LTVHILTSSSSSADALASCLRYATKGDALVLMSDGVYNVLQLAQNGLCEAMESGVDVYALQPDLDARGLTEGCTVMSIDYMGFVELTELHPRSISWN
jgi:tRNA 2-thiouridine synthesizing protein B